MLSLFSQEKKGDATQGKGGGGGGRRVEMRGEKEQGIHRMLVKQF